MMFPLVTHIFVAVVVAVFHPFAMVMSYPFHMLIFTMLAQASRHSRLKSKILTFLVPLDENLAGLYSTRVVYNFVHQLS